MKIYLIKLYLFPRPLDTSRCLWRKLVSRGLGFEKFELKDNNIIIGAGGPGDATRLQATQDLTTDAGGPGDAIGLYPDSDIPS